MTDRHRRVPGPHRQMSDRREREEQERRWRLDRATHKHDYCPPIEWGALEARLGPLSTTKPHVRLIGGDHV
jgi:hypothetical protein